ncbi:major facilitator superfamily [Heterobasidion irregulare TC 32-1]|uniref:Major facilitator superfamily n=1 Tax=Heterobasidion irregulare (strain TC 32-1) TaxID=747525 RepID=W4KIK1_HETIT|nr:major facilitator superfamily [Heterobasidion irregulare TC 32-1]ETW85534.1 major facilitator superfamily [Heterobasidion irregulare TC 32-1]
MPPETNTPHGPGEVPEPRAAPSASERARRAARHVEWDAAPDAVRPASASALAESSAPRYPGTGTRGDPFVVDWDLGDAENPYNWSTQRKWAITSQLALGTWTVSFSSSAYSGGMAYLKEEIPMSEEVVVLGISLYVLGFALGPRLVFLCTYSTYTLFHLGGALGHNVPTILTTRLLSGIFGSSPLTNAGGAISDIFNARERGVASAIYSTAPYLGPVIGPIVGGFVSQNPKLGWRFSFWLMFIFSAVTFILGVIVTPETYGPVLLRRRARKLQKQSGGSVHYTTIYDLGRHLPFRDLMRANLTRPFRFLFTEPIVALIALYISVTYATLYAEFSAFPIVFQEHRGFTAGEGGLAFLGIGVGVVLGTALAPIQNRLYWRAMDKSESGHAPPEARLYLSIVGAILLPAGLFWFAWTTFPSIHWIVPILGGIPLGTAIALILQSLTAYMMDTYTIYCASAIAATVLLRSVLAAAFPLFSPVMFRALGDQWASSVFAFLALAIMPVPILFWKYGRRVRARSRFAWHEPTGQFSDGTATSSRATTIREKDRV